MARIILEPKESFEHYHSHASKTIHIKGEIKICMAGDSHKMEEGKSIDIPEKTPHTIINIGENEAEVGCIGTGVNLQHKT